MREIPTIPGDPGEPIKASQAIDAIDAQNRAAHEKDACAKDIESHYDDWRNALKN